MATFGWITKCVTQFSDACSSWPTGFSVDVSYDCAGYDVVHLYDVDVGQHFFYDRSTGALVAVASTGAAPPTTQCLAGPATFALPAACLNIGSPCLAGDAGAD